MNTRRIAARVRSYLPWVSLLSGLWLAGCGAETDGADEAPEQEAALFRDVTDLLLPPRIMAPELADPVSLARLAEGRDVLPVFADVSRRYELQSSTDRNDAEAHASVFLENGNRDMSNFICRSLDANIGNLSYPPPHYDTPLCPEWYVHGAMLARFRGAGTLSRLWFVTNLGRRGIYGKLRIRIYRNGQTTPVVDVPYSELIDGTNPVFAPPFGMPVDTQVAWYYPVVFTDGLIIAIDHLPELDAVWYQAQVLRDGGHNTSASALTAQRETARAALQTAMPDPGEHSLPLVLAPAQEGSLDVAGPATLQTLSLSAASLAALDPLRLRVTWDDELTPAIDLPARELFGAALSLPNNSAWVRSESSAEGIKLSFALPMPFRSHARVALANTGNTSTSVVLGISSTTEIPSATFGKLYAQRNETVGPTTNKLHPLASATGRGRWVGLCAAIEGHAWKELAPLLPVEGLNVLEGDPTTRIDGVTLQGTGTEELFDNVFYFQNAPITTPFTQAYGVVNGATKGQASACRWDTHGTAYDFTSSLDSKLEIGASQPQLLDRYRTVAFLYR